ncbi:MAG: LysR family transcriptional regulator [Bacilli bacterium]|nr:LysR family transcriptional regulator [Bacilli bacterium]
MEIRVLKYFLTVAREENITRAAEVLHITQPTLSRQLIQLEEKLGCQLFVRGKNKIILTEAGMLLKRRAQEIVDMANKTENELMNKETLVCGEIFIGGGETYLMSYLSHVMKDFHDVYPQVTYRLYSGNADDVKERIDNGLIDIALLNEPVDITKYDFVRIPEKDKWGILLLKEEELATNKYITPKDLIGKQIMCSSRLDVQSELMSWLGRYSKDVNILLTYNLIYNASLMVEAGLGYAITIDNIINISENSKICFKPFYPSLETGCVLVWKKNQTFSTPVTKFIEMLQKYFKY